MPRTSFTIINAPGSYLASIAADDLDFAWEAGDVANNNQFASTGKELILVRNDDVGAQTFTIVSIADPQLKRTGDVTDYSVGAGEYAIFGPVEAKGWRQTDGNVYINPSDANLFFAIIRLPS